MQTLFISTGCDFVSYFKSLGKATILNIFFQHAEFICGANTPGCLHHTLPHNRESGFLSFIRFIGTCYFKKHLPAFITLYGLETPKHLYNSIDPSLPPNKKHELWLKKIRNAVSNRITNEEERVPSFTSLWRHWLRSCWVSQMWQNSPLLDLYSSIPLPEHSGWMRHSDGSYVIDWEAPEIQEKIKHTIDFLTKGCSCKTGCKSNRCGCRKKSSYCGPGCECQGSHDKPLHMTNPAHQSPVCLYLFCLIVCQLIFLAKRHSLLPDTCGYNRVSYYFCYTLIEAREMVPSYY